MRPLRRPAILSRPLSTSAASDLDAVRARLRAPHSHNNVPAGIIAKVGKGLHLNVNHPLGQLKHRIQTYFESLDATPRFETFDRLSPIVTTAENFDSLLTPADHVSRRPTDTYFVDDGHLLRCHMTAHQAGLIAAGHSAFLMAGDVFRRDEIDATHYPVFHQLDGVRAWSSADLRAAGVSAADAGSAAARSAFALAHLKATLEGLVRHVFGDVQSRWVDAYFPFTAPSAELEILFEGRWLEVLGCGVIRDEILANAGRSADSVGWAFGLGLERLAMVLHGVPDIRLFWTDEPRFLEQFAGASAAPGAPPVRFRPYSKYPPCFKDITFWLPEGRYSDNDFFECVREAGGDLVERCELLDTFTHPKTARVSKCFRVHYRHMGRSLLNEEVDAIQTEVRARVASTLGATLR
jgi:phenylalanyl-tRNA synthetase alpha chain